MAHRAVAGARDRVAEEIGDPQLLQQRPQHLDVRDREVEPVIAFVQLADVGIALRVVDELVVREVMQPEVIGRRQDGKGREPIGRQLVELAVGEQHVVRAFVDGAAELMLRSADDDDGDERRRNRPPPRDLAGARRLDHPHRPGNRRRDDEVDARQMLPVGEIVARLERLHLLGAVPIRPLARRLRLSAPHRSVGRRSNRCHALASRI